MKIVVSLFIAITFLISQDSEPETTMTPIVAYWKTLNQAEKEIFLFSYLTQVYDTYDELKKDLGYGELTSWYYDHRAELVFGIFDELEETDIKEFVGWIDEYYRHEEFMDRPFYEALAFAFRFQQAAGETIWEKYENLKFGRIKPGED